MIIIYNRKINKTFSYIFRITEHFFNTKMLHASLTLCAHILPVKVQVHKTTVWGPTNFLTSAYSITCAKAFFLVQLSKHSINRGYIIHT